MIPSYFYWHIIVINSKEYLNYYVISTFECFMCTFWMRNTGMYTEMGVYKDLSGINTLQY